LAVLCGALFALALAPPAGAQLPSLTDAAPLLAPVQSVVHESPVQEIERGSPIDDVVSETPVAPVVDEVERVVSGVTGGVGDVGGLVGEGNGTPASASPPLAGPPSRPSAIGNPAADDPGTPSRRRAARGTTRDRAAARRRARPGSTRAGDQGTAAAGERPGRGRDSRAGDEDAEGGTALTRSVERLVEVVPRIVWIALGILLVAALALGVRTFVERRRARILELERESLRREVGMLERALLPEVPEQLGALATSVAYRPCAGPAAGGDFYDAFELEGGRVAVLVGDVSGHGPDALESTNAIRTGVHACLEAGMSPRMALQSVASRVHMGSNGRYATAIVAVHDPAAGTLTYAAAGHPPPIVNGSHAHEPVTVASSPPIGFGFRTGLRETTLPMPQGSVACLFTDGLLEARAGDAMLGREGLTRLLDGLGASPSADALLDRVIAEADDAPDDMAVLVLRAESAMEPLAIRTESLELDREDVEREIGELFLEACAVPAGEARRALEEARAAVERTGSAVIDVTIDDAGQARAQVTPTGVPAVPATA
jgi:hypothetical protein